MICVDRKKKFNNFALCHSKNGEVKSRRRRLKSSANDLLSTVLSGNPSFNANKGILQHNFEEDLQMIPWNDIVNGVPDGSKA